MSRAQNTSKKRFTRSAVAGGIAVLLLAGGGATWAGWNDTRSVAQGQVAAGQFSMTVTPTTASGWKLFRAQDTTANPAYDAGTDITDVSAVKLVPGDKLEYSAKIAVNLQGQNLKANLVSNAASAIPAGQESFFTITTPSLFLPGTQTSVSNPIVAPADNTLLSTEYDTKTSIVFKWDTTNASEGATQTLDLTKITLNLNQQVK